MFTGPEHASYRELMRELRLEREFEDGDVVYWTGSGPEVEILNGWRPQEDEGRWYVWLPRLDQWYELIRQQMGAYPSVVVSTVYGPDNISVEATVHGSPLRRYGKTQEEACALLWLAVRAVASGLSVP